MFPLDCHLLPQIALCEVEEWAKYANVMIAAVLHNARPSQSLAFVLCLEIAYLEFGSLSILMNAHGHFSLPSLACSITLVLALSTAQITSILCATPLTKDRNSTPLLARGAYPVGLGVLLPMGVFRIVFLL